MLSFLKATFLYSHLWYLHISSILNKCIKDWKIESNSQNRDYTDMAKKNVQELFQCVHFRETLGEVFFCPVWLKCGRPFNSKQDSSLRRAPSFDDELLRCSRFDMDKWHRLLWHKVIQIVCSDTKFSGVNLKTYLALFSNLWIGQLEGCWGAAQSGQILWEGSGAFELCGKEKKGSFLG